VQPLSKYELRIRLECLRALAFKVSIAIEIVSETLSDAEFYIWLNYPETEYLLRLDMALFDIIDVYQTKGDFKHDNSN